MQKSELGLMRSMKQQKGKQKLFALCNNNLIKCQGRMLDSRCWCFSLLGSEYWSWEAVSHTTVTTATNHTITAQEKQGKCELPSLPILKEKKKKVKKARIGFSKIKYSHPQ